MSLNNMWNFPKPSDWERFEKMVCDCASQKWGKPFCIYGRKGQKQHGIDIKKDTRGQTPMWST